MNVIFYLLNALFVRSLVLRKRSSDAFRAISTSCRGALDKLGTSRSGEHIDETRQSISTNAKVAQWRNMNLPPQFQGSVDSQEEEEGEALSAFVAINDARAFHRASSGPAGGECLSVSVLDSDRSSNLPSTRGITPTRRRADGRLRRRASQGAAAAGERPRDRRTAAGVTAVAARGLSK